MRRLKLVFFFVPREHRGLFISFFFSARKFRDRPCFFPRSHNSYFILISHPTSLLRIFVNVLGWICGKICAVASQFRLSGSSSCPFGDWAKLHFECVTRIEGMSTEDAEENNFIYLFLQSFFFPGSHVAFPNWAADPSWIWWAIHRAV